MSDTDRRLDDIEKRLARLERAAEKPAITWRDLAFTSAKVDIKGQWCQCGRDICRAPDCPSHKADPLGR